ncbi:MAG: thioredoxin family protein, partial [Candidatus Cloacimonetes bacterium]|nr:thioredoxin family protein [Candidatus Cloacimonadota bacterium]
MKIKVLGSNCSKCSTLMVYTEKAVKQAGIEADIEKITDMKQIMAYGIMTIPALVIDEKVVSVGKLLKPNQI